MKQTKQNETKIIEEGNLFDLDNEEKQIKAMHSQEQEVKAYIEQKKKARGDSK